MLAATFLATYLIPLFFVLIARPIKRRKGAPAPAVAAHDAPATVSHEAA